MNRTISLALAVLLLFSPALIRAEHNLSYMLTIGYDGNAMWQEDLRLVEGDSTPRPSGPNDIFILMVVDRDNQVLYSTRFFIDLLPAASPPQGIFDSEGNQIIILNASTSNVSNTSYVITAPYFASARSIVVFDEKNQTLLIADVSPFAPPPAPASSSGSTPPANNATPPPAGVQPSAPSSGFDFLAFIKGLCPLPLLLAAVLLASRLA